VKKICFTFAFFIIPFFVLGNSENGNIIIKKSTPIMNMKIYQNVPEYQRNRNFTLDNFVAVNVEFKKINQISNPKILQAVGNHWSPEFILKDDFEEDFPGNKWNVFNGYDGIFGEYYWDIVSRKSLSGLNSVWCAAGGADGHPDSTKYPDNCNSWLVAGPFDLRDVNWAVVKFSLWLESEPEHDYLFWMASVDNINFYGQGISGNTDEWQRFTFNLTDVDQLGNVTGQPQVWIAFMFYSNETNVAEGAYLDDITIEVAQLDTFKIVKSFPAPSVSGTGLTGDGQNLWVADEGTKNIFKLDADGNRLDTIPAPGNSPTGLAWDTKYLWNADSHSSKIYKIDILGNNLDSIDSPGSNPYGIVWDGSVLWHSDCNSQEIVGLELPNYNRYSSFSVPDVSEITPTGIAIDNSKFWLADHENSIIYKMDFYGNVYNYYLAPALEPNDLIFDDPFLWCLAQNTIYKLSPQVPPLLDVKITRIDTVEFPDLVVGAIIKNEQNKPLLDANKDNFNIKEDFVKQDIKQLEMPIGGESVNFAMVLDFSGSMSNAEIISLKTAARFVIRNLMRSQDRGAIVRFACTLDDTNNIFLTSNKDSLEQVLDKDKDRTGGTALYNAIFKALRLLCKEKEKNAIILIGDGEDSSSDSVLQSVIDKARAEKIPIFALALGDPVETDTLKALSCWTGASYYRALTFENLTSIYETIAYVLPFQYLISYTTHNSLADGSFREVSLKLDYNTLYDFDRMKYKAPGAELIKLWISDALTAQYAGSIEVPINLERLSENDIYGVKLTICYAPSVLEAIGLNSSGTIIEEWSNSFKKIKDGQIRIALAGNLPIPKDGKLVKIKFKVLGKPGQASAINFIDARLNEGFPVALTENGYFIVSDKCCISGSFKYCINEEPVDSVLVTLIGNSNDSTYSDSSGYYCFCDLSVEGFELKPTLNGKINGAISPLDASYVLQFIEGNFPLTPCQMLAADVNKDSSVTIQDAEYILNYCVSDENKFPTKNDWTFIPTDFKITEENWYKVPEDRKYASFENGLENQDFQAVLFGDVTVNWHQDQSSLSKNNFSPVSLLMIGDPVLISPEKLRLNIGIDAIPDLRSFGLGLKYVSDIVEDIKVIPTEMIQNHVLVYHSQNSHLKIAAAGSQPIEGTGSLLQLEVELAENAQQEMSNALTITEFSLNEWRSDGLNQPVNFKAITALPTEFGLAQNFPNPFNNETVIKYQVPHKSHVKIAVYNLLGRLVGVLVEQEQAAGFYQIKWNGLDASGRALSSGVYLCRMEAQNYRMVRKLALLR